MSKQTARPCNVEWIRDIKNQCQAAHVPVFCKQLGSNPTMSQRCGDCDPCIAGQPCCIGETEVRYFVTHPKGADPSEWPEDLRVREFPKANL